MRFSEAWHGMTKAHTVATQFSRHTNCVFLFKIMSRIGFECCSVWWWLVAAALPRCRAKETRNTRVKIQKSIFYHFVAMAAAATKQTERHRRQRNGSVSARSCDTCHGNDAVDDRDEKNCKRNSKIHLIRLHQFNWFKYMFWFELVRAECARWTSLTFRASFPINEKFKSAARTTTP